MNAVTPPGQVALPPSALLPGARAYSPWRGFFFPSLRVPALVQAVDGDAHLGLVLGGSDPLGQHSWRLAGYVQGKRDGDAGGPYLGGQATYRNTMLAPWTVLLSGEAFHGSERVEPALADADPTYQDRRTRDLTLQVGRSWRGGTWTVLAGAVTTEDRLRPDGSSITTTQRLGGPFLLASYAGGDGTPYTGPRRAVAASLTAESFPARLSSLDRGTSSLRGALTLRAPVPATRRHLLRLAGVARAIVPGEDLLELGGPGAFTPIGLASNQPDPAEPEFDTPPHLRLLEPLRGYEDTVFAVSRFAAAELSWTYPLILDRGVASTLWIFPATFVRQLDVELFALAALAADRAGAQAGHAVAGGALTLRLSLMRIPLALRYQLARRLRDDEAVIQLFGVGADR